jgi:hypothetical protein
MTCEYADVAHDCTGAADYFVWSDVNLRWFGACTAVIRRWQRSEGRLRTVVVAAVD